MTRPGALAWFVLVLAAGFATFRVKYAVQDIDDQLHRVRKQTTAEQQEIRVLSAEWTYLNQPERLAELNRRFLALQPIAVAQLRRTIADIPLRQPTPALDNAVAVAAAGGAAAQPAMPTQMAAVKTAMVPQAAPIPASASAKAVPAIRVAKAAPDRLMPGRSAPRSLDALIGRIAEAR